jgi:glycosyltransferase involved in cell wall biosynthesis
MSLKLISLVVPFFNEEQGIAPFFEQIFTVLKPLESGHRLEIICVNDGSKDRTLTELKSAKSQYPSIKIIDLSRNFGKEAAITAGLDHAQGDAVIPIDADLQHPPEVVLDLIAKWQEGFEVVLAKRIDRETDGTLHKWAANAFYRFSKKITHVEIPANVGDFRLMDRKVVEAVKSLRENTRFMKGIFAWVGFKTTTVEYKVEPRRHGHTSFNLWKLWNLALEGITSFSTIPLRVWTYLGGVVSLVAFVYALYLFMRTIFYGVDTPGYASLMIVILFFGGVQLIGIGVLGEYVGRIFNEVKRRPTYIVRDIME